MSALQSQRQRLLDELNALPAERGLPTTRERVMRVMDRIAQTDPMLAEAMINLVANTLDPYAHPALGGAIDLTTPAGDFPRQSAYRVQT